MGIFDIFKIKKANRVEVISDEKNIQVLKERIISFISKYNEGILTQEDLKQLSVMLVDYCKQVIYPNVNLETPSVVFSQMKHTTCASYAVYPNTINVNEVYLNRILTKERNLSSLFDTIGHEMEHYYQYSQMIEYDKMPVEEQQSTDIALKLSVDSFKKYFNLTKEDVMMLHKLLAPYMKSDEIPKGYKNVEDFCADVSYASYYTIKAEQNAREAGVSFALHFYNGLMTQSDRKTFFEGLKGNIQLQMQKQKDKFKYAMHKRSIDKFNKTHSINAEQILEIVEGMESKSGLLSKEEIHSYQNALRFLIKDKTIEQRKSLLKNAIFNGYKSFCSIIIDSIQKDMDLKINQNNLSTYISDCLQGKSYGDTEPELNEEIFCVDYTKILNQQDLERIIIDVAKKSSFNASMMLVWNCIEEFSLDMILKCQDIAVNHENGIYAYKLFFMTIFEKVSSNAKQKYLDSNQLIPDIKNILIDCIIQDDNKRIKGVVPVNILTENNSNKEGTLEITGCMVNPEASNEFVKQEFEKVETGLHVKRENMMNKMFEIKNKKETHYEMES